MKRAMWVPAIALLACVPGLTKADDTECDRGSEVDAIGVGRAAFNDAIRDGDLAVIEDVLATDVVLVAGTHSDLFLDRDAQLEIWRGNFDEGAGRFVYERTPSCIRLSSISPMALERGEWRGEASSGDFVSGSYSAKWRKIDEQWRLEAEVFMTGDCGGAGCPE